MCHTFFKEQHNTDKETVRLNNYMHKLKSDFKGCTRGSRLWSTYYVYNGTFIHNIRNIHGTAR